MNPDPLKKFIWDKLQDGNFEGFKGGNASFHLPVQEDLLNFILETLISSSNGMKDFKEIEFTNLNNNEFVVYVDHRKLNKTIRGRITGIDLNQHSEPVLNIQFLEGIRFYEKLAVDSLLTIQKGWSWFKSRLKEAPEAPERSGSFVDISSGGIKINLPRLFIQQGMGYLNHLIVWENFSTEDNRLIIDFSIKT